MTAPTPWFYTVEVFNHKARCVLRDNTGMPIGVLHDEAIAKLTVHAVNTVPQLHVSQIMKEPI